jgi:hypothetical protein
VGARSYSLPEQVEDVFDRLKADWEAWNGSMLPEHARPVTYFHSGNFVADHYGVTNPAPAAAPASLPQNCGFAVAAFVCFRLRPRDHQRENGE